MKAIAEYLQQQGEKVQFKNNAVRVKFSSFISILTIKKDLANNSLLYSYNKIGDLLVIIFSSVTSVFFFTEDNFLFAMFYVFSALALAIGCIVKELKVSIIKQKVDALVKKHPEILTTKLQRISPLSVRKSI